MVVVIHKMVLTALVKFVLRWTFKLFENKQ